MGSKLSSMLVQQGLLAVGDLQDAFARQVVRGGALDTILLERELVDEDVLLALLSKAIGLTPMPPDLLDHIDSEVKEKIDLETAERLGIAPLGLRKGELQVLVGVNGDQVAIEELAYELDAKLHARAATELRILQARHRLYDSPLPRRFKKLLKKFGDSPSIAASLSLRAGAAGDGFVPLTPIARKATSEGFLQLDSLDPSATTETSHIAGPQAPPPPQGSFVEDDTPIDTPINTTTAPPDETDGSPVISQVLSAEDTEDTED
ncbi:MAG: hypothetical protein KAI47_05820, partial [Deltaproteobacteria bacterium]|nr:hypothetical protein [Deltaproteobacteria bacterium]